MWRYIWGLIVVTSIMIASSFVFLSATEYRRSTVVTTIKSTTESLDKVSVNMRLKRMKYFCLKVYFPSVTICNINQVRESFFLDMELNSRESKYIMDLLYKQFYSGSLQSTTESEKRNIKAFLTSENYVKAEFLYHNITTKQKFGNFNNFEEYLAMFKDGIEKGAQLTRLAVQEPLGTDT